VGSAFRRALDYRLPVAGVMRPRHPEPLKNFSYLGFHRYFLTFCTNNRAPLFTSAAPVDLVRAQISRAACESSFAVPAYCFMPDHLHLLVEAKSNASDGRGFIKRSRHIPASIIRRPLAPGCGNGTATTMSYGTTRGRSSSLVTFCRIRCARVWCSGSRTIPLSARWSGPLRLCWTGFARNERQRQQVRLKPDPTGDPRRIQAGNQSTVLLRLEVDDACIRRAASVGSAF
jgi:REP element-mobilizing transposase RayT